MVPRMLLDDLAAWLDCPQTTLMLEHQFNAMRRKIKKSPNSQLSPFAAWHSSNHNKVMDNHDRELIDIHEDAKSHTGGEQLVPKDTYQRARNDFSKVTLTKKQFCIKRKKNAVKAYLAQWKMPTLVYIYI